MARWMKMKMTRRMESGVTVMLEARAGRSKMMERKRMKMMTRSFSSTSISFQSRNVSF